ncbi:HD domain-containing phosphohydrolase [Chloroflexota bacterium]
MTAITNLSPNIAGLLCYSLGWISGIILRVLRKEDSFVRFHANQSIITFGILTVLIIVLNLIKITNGVLYWLLFALYWIVIILTVFLWVFLMYKAYKGQTYKLIPVDNIAITQLRPNVAGLLCYSLGWISGIILRVLRKEDSFVRFHANQSIIIFGILTVLIIVLNLIEITNGVLYWLLFALYWIMIVLTVFLWIFLMYKAYKGQTYKLILIDNIATKLFRPKDRDVIANGKVEFSVKVEEHSATFVELIKQEAGVIQDSDSIKLTFNETVNSIITLCESRDPYTASHQNRVAKLSCAIATEMGLSEDQIEGIRITGLIHDIGKVAVPTEILSKSGKLTDHEFGIIVTHPQIAYDILKGVHFPWPVAQAILQHHERLDGSGYPSGLSGEEIILEARILTVSDTIEAMASHRPYRPAIGIDRALDEISQQKGITYDAKVVDACLEIFNQKHFEFEKNDAAEHNSWSQS